MHMAFALSVETTLLTTWKQTADGGGDGCSSLATRSLRKECFSQCSGLAADDDDDYLLNSSVENVRIARLSA